MAENTKIEWATHTFNPWIGCTKVAPGCMNCYAEEMMDTRFGKVHWGPMGTRVKTADTNWQQPLKWNRAAKCKYDHNGDGDCHRHPNGCPRPRVFCASLADVFEDWGGPIVDHKGEVLYRNLIDGSISPQSDFVPARPEVLTKWGHLGMNDLRRDLYALIDATPNLDWMLLTKRPENIPRMWPVVSNGRKPNEPIVRYRPNVWLYTSVSEQESADRNIPLLLQCRDLVPVLGVSAEPLLGEIDFTHMDAEQSVSEGMYFINALTGRNRDMGRPCEDVPALDHVIVGGESGTGARKSHLEWYESIVSQCRAAEVPVYVKQLGANHWSECEEFGNSRVPLSDSKGGDPSEWPEDLRVREMPVVGASVS